MKESSIERFLSFWNYPIFMKLSKLVDLHNFLEPYSYNNASDIGHYLMELCEVSEENPIDTYQNASFTVNESSKVNDTLYTGYRIDNSKLIIIRSRCHTYIPNGELLDTNKEEYDRLMILGNDQKSIDDFVKDLTNYIHTELKD